MPLIDKYARTPIYAQIVEGIEREIAAGLLKEGDKLPSVREYSVLLDANPNTIQKAIGELEHAGVIISRQGRGCFVASGARDAIRARGQSRLQEMGEIARSLLRAGYSRGELFSALEDAISESTQGKGGKNQ